VIGVLAMTVELGRFGVLQMGLGDQQLAVLVDTRADWQGRDGLVLHHPELARLRLDQLQGVSLPAYYLSRERLEQFVRLRREKLDRERARAELPWAEQLTAREPALAGSLDFDYRDPVGGEIETSWMAAFEPVLLRGRADEIRDTGWVVIVQEADGG
jgi:hypothetical protein